MRLALFAVLLITVPNALALDAPGKRECFLDDLDLDDPTAPDPERLSCEPASVERFVRALLEREAGAEAASAVVELNVLVAGVDDDLHDHHWIHAYAATDDVEALVLLAIQRGPDADEPRAALVLATDPAVDRTVDGFVAYVTPLGPGQASATATVPACDGPIGPAVRPSWTAEGGVYAQSSAYGPGTATGFCAVA